MTYFDDDAHYYDPRDFAPEPEKGVCEGCGRECDIVDVDYGIGSYEYWGFRGVHHQYAPGSSCCGEEVFKGGCKVLRTSTHTARKDHKDGTVKVGDVYRVTVYRTWREDGPSWVWQEKRIIKKNVRGFPERLSA